MIKKKLLFLTTLLCALPLALGVSNWNSIPQDIPVHWSLTGDVDRFAPKAVVVFGLPLTFVMIHIFCHFLATREEAVDSRTHDFEGLIYWMFPFLSTVFCPVVIFSLMGMAVKLFVLVPAVVGFVCVFAAVWLARIRSLSNEKREKAESKELTENQKKAILFTQMAVCVGGTSLIFCSFCSVFFVGFVLLGASLVVSLIYSLVLHKKRK